MTLTILAALLGLIAAGSGAGKLAKSPAIMESMEHVGVKPAQVPLLGALEILGALGLIVGIWVTPLGVAAAACLALYFVGAIIAHIRVGEKIVGLLPPIVILAIAIATTLFELKR